jgi:histone-binding protein RBBP4
VLWHKCLCLTLHLHLTSPLAADLMMSSEAHMAEVNCLAFNPMNPNILATGSADKTVSGTEGWHRGQLSS